MKIFLVMAFGIMINSCGGVFQGSFLDGHYEDSDEQAMSIYEDAQVVSPEWLESRGVVVSVSLFKEYQGADLGKAILDSGVDTLWVMVPSYNMGDLESPEFRNLRNLVGDDINKVKLVKQKSRGRLTVWARDWAPLGAKSSEGDLRFIDFNYYPGREADDSTPQSMGSIEGIDRVSVPVYNEGGNFMNNTLGDCLMTSRVSDANLLSSRKEDIILDEDQIIDYYQRFAGCKKVKIFPRMPFEQTGHIDMWAKFLNDKTVVVSQLPENIALSYSKELEADMAEKIRDYLDDRALDIEAMGYEVRRIPMPEPTLSYKKIFRSYTNSLLLNGTAIIPQYAKFNGRYPYSDSEKIASMEAEVMEIYKEYDFNTVYVLSLIHI